MKYKQSDLPKSFIDYDGEEMILKDDNYYWGDISKQNYAGDRVIKHINNIEYLYSKDQHKNDFIKNSIIKEMNITKWNDSLNALLNEI